MDVCSNLEVTLAAIRPTFVFAEHRLIFLVQKFQLNHTCTLSAGNNCQLSIEFWAIREDEQRVCSFCFQFFFFEEILVNNGYHSNTFSLCALFNQRIPKK